MINAAAPTKYAQRKGRQHVRLHERSVEEEPYMQPHSQILTRLSNRKQSRNISEAELGRSHLNIMKATYCPHCNVTFRTSGALTYVFSLFKL